MSVRHPAACRPAELTAQLREIGSCWHEDIRQAGDRTKALYAPLLKLAPRDEIEVHRNQSYGAHERQVLDVYSPRARVPGPHPVMAFVHGGAFVRGSKDISEHMYGNVLAWFARRGLVGVNIEYRLAPDAPYPGGAQDIALACEWIARNIRQWGGDPGRVCLIGHSAGGTHAATYACDPALGLLQQFQALVLISARLRADVREDNPNAAGVRAYFGDLDDAELARRSPVTHAAHLRVPVLIANAEFENPWLDVYGLEFAHAVGMTQGKAPLHLTLADHNHVSLMAHFDTDEHWLGDQILRFCADAFGNGGPA